MTWLLFLLQAAISSVGVLLLRFAMPQIVDRGNTIPWPVYVWAGLGAFAYGASFLLWLYILSRTNVSYAYPVTVGLTLALTIIGSVLILGEKISVVQIVGIILMAVALFLMSAGHSATSSGDAITQSPPAA